MKTLKYFITASLLLSTVYVFSQATEATYIDLKGEALYPEGILALPDGGFLIGGFGDGTIQKINTKNESSYFSKPGENGMALTVGMAVDTKNNYLWVANFNFKTASGKPGSNLKMFDLKSGKLIKTIPENYIEGVFFNEIAIDDKGTIYVTNTFGPQIYTANANATTPSVFVENDLLSNPAPNQPFDLNGLSITPGHKYLIASVMDRLDAGDGRLVRINLKTKAVSPIKLNGEKAIKAFAGSDGMFFNNNTLFMVNVYSKAGAIITADFNKDYSEAKLTIRDKFNTVYNRPTASAIKDGRLYTVNSQLNHIIDDADGKLNTPPSLPFKVVSVPLNKLLTE